jgi:hypothetical protein
VVDTRVAEALLSSRNHEASICLVCALMKSPIHLCLPGLMMCLLHFLGQIDFVFSVYFLVFLFLLSPNLGS